MRKTILIFAVGVFLSVAGIAAADNSPTTTTGCNDHRTGPEPAHPSPEALVRGPGHRRRRELAQRRRPLDRPE